MLYYFYFVIFNLIYYNKDILLFYRLISEGLPQDVLDTVANLLEEFEENPKGKFFLNYFTYIHSGNFIFKMQ